MINKMPDRFRSGISNLLLMRNIRINDIVFTYSEFNKKYELIHKTPNPLYGKENEFDFVKEGDYYVKFCENMPVRYSKTCFENPETGLLIAWFEENSDKSIPPDLVWCMNRPLELSEDEFADFMDVVRLAYKEFERNNIETSNKKED